MEINERLTQPNRSEDCCMFSCLFWTKGKAWEVFGSFSGTRSTARTFWVHLSLCSSVCPWPLAVWTVSSCRFSRFPKFATCWSCTHLHKSPLRTAVTLGPLFDAYLLNIGGKCLASTSSNANMKASAKRSDVFHSYMDGLQELQLRHGNKLVGAVESTPSP